MIDTHPLWNGVQEKVRPGMLKILNCKTEKSAADRLYAIGMINQSLWPGQRCIHHPKQEESIIRLKISPCLQELADQLNGSPIARNLAQGKLLQYYRECWKRLENLENGFIKEKEKLNRPIQTALF